MNKIGVWLFVLLIFGYTFGQPPEATMRIKREALKSARIALNLSRYTYIYRASNKNCAPKSSRLSAGDPFSIQALIRPSRHDIQKLRRKIAPVKAHDSRFARTFSYSLDLVKTFYANQYRVPIYDEHCGYLFHIKIGASPDDSSFISRFFPLSRKKAQGILASSDLPIFMAFFGTLTPQRDTYLWVAGSRAVEAFGKNELYQIVNRVGKPVAPLETQLQPQIFQELFVTPDGTPSAWWYFRLPIRLEPYPTKP